MKRIWPTYVILGLIMCACGGMPSYVIPEKKMAQLMADVYMGDAVVELNPKDFRSDSLRRLLQQSIYEKHGVTASQVDTSLVWYGNNLQAYMDMCKLTEEILQNRIEEAEKSGGKLDKAPRLATLDGDSVDVWAGERIRRNYAGMPSDYMTFNMTSDKNWDRGDRYTLSVKSQDAHSPITLNMAVDYNDGSSEYSQMTVPAEGVTKLLLVLDSAKVATNVYGMIYYSPMVGEVSYLDSITLVRTRGRNDNVRARSHQKVLERN